MPEHLSGGEIVFALTGLGALVGAFLVAGICLIRAAIRRRRRPWLITATMGAGYVVLNPDAKVDVAPADERRAA